MYYLKTFFPKDGTLSIISLPVVPVVIIFNAILTGKSRRFVYMVITAIALVQLHKLGYSETQ